MKSRIWPYQDKQSELLAKEVKEHKETQTKLNDVVASYHQGTAALKQSNKLLQSKIDEQIKTLDTTGACDMPDDLMQSLRQLARDQTKTTD